MGKIPRAFAWRTSLTILIIFFIIVRPANIDIVGASDTDIPEPLSMEPTANMFVDSEDADKGFTLIAPFNGKKVFLVDNDGDVVHTWQSGSSTTGTTELLEDGTLLRGRSGSVGQSHGVHILDWDGKVLWDYQPPAPYRLHHDIEPMPNGNILLNAWVDYTYAQVVDMGRDPDITPPILPVEPILEIKPNGTNGGDIVWMWNPVDHIIQDYDPDKPNYGAVRDHPELLDINFPREFRDEWQHSNAVSYNAELDQIMITNRNFDEFWVIDHNTTTEEAAGHTGGAHGKGGDILYRWGNPQAYGAGSESDQVLYGPHDAHWVNPGLPGAGNIIIFNNGINMFMIRPDGNYSTVEEMVPHINATGGYELAPGSAYGPSDSIWRYNASPPEDFFAWSMGGVERLPNGNTLVCGGSSGYNFEVDPKGDVVWDYKSNSLFKISRYYPPALDPVPDLQATEDVMLTVNVSSFMSDPDTDREDLVIDEDSTYVSVSGHELQLLYHDGIKTDVFNLTVSDGIFEVGRDVRVNITPVNDPPVLTPIPDIAAIEAVPYILELEPFILDPDTEIGQMRFTVDSSFVTVHGKELRLLYPNGVLTDRIGLSVSDGELEDRTEILVNVTPVNDPPTVDRIGDQEGVEDVPWTIDLGMYIRDVDSPMEGITVASGSPYASVTGLHLSLLYPEGVTSDAVSLTVSDGEDETVVWFNVVIEPVNDPPVVEDLPPLTVTEDEPFSLDVGPAIFDVDTPREELTLRVDSPFVAVDGLVLTLLYPDGVIEDEVVVEILDGVLQVSTAFLVNVRAVNDPPVLGDIMPFTVTEDEPFSLDVGPAIFDPDTPKEELTLKVDSPYVDVDGLVLNLLYPDGVLKDEVVIGLWDGDLHVSATLMVTVEPVNDPPWWAELPEIASVEDVEGTFNLGPYMQDTDTPLWELVVEARSTYGRMEGHVFKYSYPEGVPGEQVAFTLSDGEFEVVLWANVTVTPVNDDPELSNACVDPPKGDTKTRFNFRVVFSDIDAGSVPPEVVVVIDGTTRRCASEEPDSGLYGEGVVFWLETDLGPGIHYFHFNADDGEGGAVTTDTLSVFVRDTPVSRDGTSMTAIWISPLVIGMVVLVAILLAGRRRLLRPPG